MEKKGTTTAKTILKKNKTGGITLHNYLYSYSNQYYKDKHTDQRKRTKNWKLPDTSVVNWFFLTEVEQAYNNILWVSSVYHSDSILIYITKWSPQ